MKKTLLLLTLCLACLTIHAQKIDKKLLIGRWDLYNISSKGYSICRDSTAQGIKAIIQALKADTPTIPMASDDSLLLVKKLTSAYNDLFKAYFTFDNKGHYTFLKCKKGKCKEDQGMYKWAGTNKIIENEGGESELATFTILNLTATKLLINTDSEAPSKGMEMTFTRAK